MKECKYLLKGLKLIFFYLKNGEIKKLKKDRKKKLVNKNTDFKKN